MRLGTQIGEIDGVAVVKDVAREFQHDNVSALAAASAYRLVLALPSSMIFFAALSEIVARYTGVDVFSKVLVVASRALPAPVYGTVELVLQDIQRHGGTGLLSVGFVLALWSASTAVGSLMQALNRAYDVEESRSFIQSKLLQLGLTIGLGLLVITAFILFVFGGRLGHWLASLGGLGATFSAAWSLARWPAILVFVMLSLALLYWIGPAIDHAFRWIAPGAVLAMLLWLGATYGFSLYLRLSNPGSAYGALGAVVVLLFFLYVSSIILLLGAELNAALAKRYDPRVIAAKAAHPERQTDRPAALRRARALAWRRARARRDTAARGVREEAGEPAASSGSVPAFARSSGTARPRLVGMLDAFTRLVRRRPAGPA